MPRYAHAQLRWSEQAQSYALFIGEQASKQPLTREWLEQNTSFAFHSRLGTHYTVRKQRVQRGSSYWYAYRRQHGRIVKRYLGKTEDLTYARLEEIARLLEGMPDAQQHALAESNQAPALDQMAPTEALPLLLSKLSPPSLHASLLERSRLLALLDAGSKAPLTLLSAPAGFGKTTLVSQWLAARRASLPTTEVAWVSLEASENDPLRFWRYLIAACQAFQVDLQAVHSALGSLAPQPPFLPSSLDTMLTTLLNALAQSSTQGILVLEDYHVITSPLIHEALSFFLEHLPTTLHLVMITRSDPPFSLARLRARNALYEIRAADLCFSQEEATLLLQQALSFPLEASTIRRLHTQLEGWGAGLHLAKLALQRTAMPAEGEQVLARFPLGNASLQEFFVSEVLSQQPEPVQQFLLQTSILTRLAASLCDAVTAQANSQDMLTQLEHLDLFLKPLPSTGQWYRYHALFAEAMRHEARRRLGDEQLRKLAARASLWYEAHGYPVEAIDTALDAQDYLRAASLIEDQSFPGELQEPHTLHRWLKQLPDTLLEQQPVLCLSYATTLLFMNPSWLPEASTLREIEKLLHSAEHHFYVADKQARLGELYAFRALLALRQGDMPATTQYAKQALERLPQTPLPTRGMPGGTRTIWRGLSLSIVAETLIEAGRFPEARAVLLESQALCEAAENHYFQRVALLKLAQVFFEQGENQQATALYRQVLASGREGGPVYTLCSSLSGLAALCYERNELEGASQYAQEALTASRSQPLVYYEVRAALILARVQQALGQALVAQQQLAALLDKVPLSLPLLLQEVQTAQARLALSTGDQITIHRWATGRKPPHNFSQEIEEELLISRWLRSQGKLEEASLQLGRLLLATQEAQHMRRMLEIQVEMVLVAAASKRKTEALQLLRESLAQALAENAQRLFLDAGEQMAILLRTLLPQVHEQPLQAYMRTLLSAFPAQEQNGAQALASPLVEPLSPQEMRVLRLLIQQRSNADIANELVVSVNTIRTQVQSIYYKLGVHTRRAASEVARELHLV